MSQIILGIDPGTNILGYGLIEVNKSNISLLLADIIYLKQEENPYKKLSIIYSQIAKVIAQYQPVAVAIEAPFFGKNVQSMLKLGRAQGVAIAAVVQSGLDITEYSPKKVKQSITGNGNASKEQVSAMACHILNISEAPAFFDETDALAVAICHYLQMGKPKTTTAVKAKKGSKAAWSNFIDENKNRVL